MGISEAQAATLKANVDANRNPLLSRALGQGTTTKKAKGRKRQAPGMNKSERAYAQILEIEKRTGHITDYLFEGVTLKLGKDCRFTPDFFVIDREGFVQFHDVKAFYKNKGTVRIEDDARVKLSVAATSLFPFFEFRCVWQQGAEWHHKVY